MHQDESRKKIFLLRFQRGATLKGKDLREQTISFKSTPVGNIVYVRLSRIIANNFLTHMRNVPANLCIPLKRIRICIPLNNEEITMRLRAKKGINLFS